MWKFIESGIIERMFGSVEYKRADLLAEDAEALVNTVNCVGVMGKGLALQFKKRFRANFEAYARACEQGEVHPGRMFVFELQAEASAEPEPAAGAQPRLPHFAEEAAVYDAGAPRHPRYIINFPTKNHWRARSRMRYIDEGLQDLVRQIGERGIRSVAVPALGCDLGGLDWDEVRPRIERALGALDGVKVVVFEPRGAS